MLSPFTYNDEGYFFARKVENSTDDTHLIQDKYIVKDLAFSFDPQNYVKYVFLVMVCPELTENLVFSHGHIIAQVVREG